MATENQTKANQENAAHSTGPRTPEGKAHASLNALRHGFRARDAVLPEEDRAEYLELLAALEAQFLPATPLETLLIRQMAAAQWRLLRHARVETGLLSDGLAEARRCEYDTDDPEDYEPEQKRTQDEADYDEHTRLLGIAFHNTTGPDPMGKLTRYETAARRSFFKALEALQVAQDRRRAAPPEK